MNHESEYIKMNHESEYIKMNHESEYIKMNHESEYIKMNHESEYIKMNHESEYMLYINHGTGTFISYCIFVHVVGTLYLNIKQIMCICKYE